MIKPLQCERCFYRVDHPLGLVIDETGICSGCRIHEEKDLLDWSARWSALKELINPYRIKSGKSYDCIVPVSGAGDSYYIVDMVKNKLGMNPLLVTYNKYFNTPLGIRNLSNLRIAFNCDILIQNVNPVSVKKITRTTLRELGSVYWHCIAGQTAFPVQVSVRMGIPLIIWGAHQGLEQVGMYSHLHEVEMTRRYRSDHDLMGYEATDLLSDFDLLNEDDICQYYYPSDADIHRVGVRGIYLGNYIRWDPKAQHEKMINEFNYRTARFSRTFEMYDHVDCWNYLHLHDYLKLIKCGYSKVTDHATRELRHGRISREEGKFLISQHQFQNYNYGSLFCEWLGINQKSLQFIIDRHRNSNYWDEVTPGRWEMKNDPPDYQVDLHLGTNERFRYIENGSLELDKEIKYITLGRGYGG
jgi:N-acetyl sugar amidotransferase